MLVHLVADYGPGDLAAAEVAQRLALHLPGAQVHYTPVPPFDTVSAGFCVAQLALTEGPEDRVVYCNVAPRADEDAPRDHNEGERLVAARLASGVLVVAVDSGHTFSFLRDEALREVRFPETGSQFRSRDAFPGVVAQLASGSDLYGDPIEPPPPAPAEAVLYTDGYGNLKTSWSSAPASPGSEVTVRIGTAVAAATVSDGTFSVPTGKLAFAPGSSGWNGTVWWELLLRGGSAATLLGNPTAGSPIEIS